MNLPKSKFKGFWNDNEGLSISDVSILCTLPLYLFVAIKYAIASDLSMTQVDFFSSVTYVILLAVGGKAIERFGFPNLRNRSGYVDSGNYNYNNGSSQTVTIVEDNYENKV